MIKMFLCIIAVMAYVVAAGKAVNKISIFIAMFFYLIYLAVEVVILMKMNKQKNA
jgi:heme/copper-type cytochrome/quinol oxidase subunit 4